MRSLRSTARLNRCRSWCHSVADFKRSRPAKVLAMLKLILSGITFRDLSFLCDWSMWDYCSVVFDNCKVDPHEHVPWFVALTFASTSKKHRFVSRKIPSHTGIIDGVRNLINKVKWSYHHRNNSRISPSYVLKTLGPTPTCPHICAPEVSALCNKIQNVVWSAISRTLFFVLILLP